MVFALCLLSGCSADVPQIKPGACLAKDAAGEQPTPDLSSVVPCTSPHRFEVYDVLQLSSQQVTRARAQQRCVASLLRVTGYDKVRVNGKPAAAAGLVPALRGIRAPTYIVTPEAPGQAGRRDVVCMARMTVPVQAASDDVLLLSLAKTRDFPVALRPCRAYDSERQSISDAPCTKPHASETLFFFEADQTLGDAFVASIVRDPTAEKFDRFDDVCTKVLPTLLGEGFDKRLRGFGSVARRWTDESTTVRCEVGPVEFETNDLPPGSLVNTAKKSVELLTTAEK